jgi:excisionase family DNA binding protein
MLKNINPQPTYNQTEIKELERILAQNTTPPRLVSSNGEAMELPESVYQVLVNIVGKMVAGEEIYLVPSEKQLTTQEAADSLNVSRPYLIKLLETGEIPYETVGKHRRICLQNLIEYKERRSSTRKKNLQKMTEFLQEEGFYDYNGSDDNCD